MLTFISALIFSFFLQYIPIKKYTTRHTHIRDIQYTEDLSGDSPMLDQIVTISGVVTGEPYAFNNYFYFVQDANEPWCGIQVYDPNRQVAEGDLVSITGTVAEYYGTTEIASVTAFQIITPGYGGINPIIVSTTDISTGNSSAESFESCLLRMY